MGADEGTSFESGVARSLRQRVIWGRPTVDRWRDLPAPVVVLDARDAEFDAACFDRPDGTVVVRLPLARHAAVADLALALLLDRWSSRGQPPVLVVEPAAPCTERSGVLLPAMSFARVPVELAARFLVVALNTAAAPVGWYVTPSSLLSVRFGSDEALAGLVGHRLFCPGHCAGDEALERLAASGPWSPGPTAAALLAHEVAVVNEALERPWPVGGAVENHTDPVDDEESLGMTL